MSISSVLMRQLACFLSVLSFAFAFNIDVESAITHKPTVDSWFGFSLDFYTDNANNKWLLVGAPKAQSPSQNNIYMGGRMFRCNINNNTCQIITSIETRGNALSLNGSEYVQVEEKSHQYLGASVSSSPDGEYVAACAPRYVYFYMREERNGPTGYCYLASENFLDVEVVAPGRNDRKWGYHRLGYSMFGFSSAFSNQGDKLFLGGPGSWYYQGSVAVVDRERPTTNYKITENSDATHDNRYMGYSLAVGDFTGDGIDDVVLGVPRVNTVRGMIALYRHDLYSLLNITGEQDGSYFGYSLAVTDLDGNGLGDIIVGAPFYTEYITDKGVMKPKYDIGKVYVYFQERDHSFNRRTTLDGHQDWSQFGQAVAAAGDLNQDGFNDLLVGAPYDGQNKNGIVYVYNGMEGGIREKYTQMIRAEDVGRHIKQFGFSLTGGKDVDDNEYPDIAVGAYKSDHAIVFRTRSVIQIEGDMQVAHSHIDLESKQTCHSSEGSGVCSDFTICLKYDGKKAPDTLDVKVNVTFDAAKKLDARAKETATDLRKLIDDTFFMIVKQKTCRTYRYYVDKNIRDKLTPIVIEANYSISAEQRYTPVPVIDATKENSLRREVKIKNNCPEQICVPDQMIDAHPKKSRLLVGSGERVVLKVEVENLKDEAFESQLFLVIPPGLDYAGSQMNGNKSNCTFTSQKDKDVLLCDLANPLSRYEKRFFEFEFATENVDPKLKEVVFTMNVTSKNEEETATLDNNRAVVKIPLKIHAQVKLYGNSVPEYIAYSSDEEKGPKYVWGEDIGPKVVHVYDIQNTGTALKGVKFDIYWPSKTPEGKQLLYLLDLPQYTSPIVKGCKIMQTQNVNPYSLTIDRAGLLPNRPRVKRDVVYNEDDPYNLKARTMMSTVIEQIKDGVQDYVMLGADTLNRQKMDCGVMNCTQISCELGPMGPDDDVVIEVHSRVFINTLIEEAYYDSQISSFGVAEVEPIQKPTKFKFPLVSTAVITQINPSRPKSLQRGVPWWLILLAVLIGITLLALLILLLWKCNFFKRNRPPRGQAVLTGPPQSEHYGFAGYPSGYGPRSQYSEVQHGPML